MFFLHWISPSFGLSPLRVLVLLLHGFVGLPYAPSLPVVSCPEGLNHWNFSRFFRSTAECYRYVRDGVILVSSSVPPSRSHGWVCPSSPWPEAHLKTKERFNHAVSILFCFSGFRALCWCGGSHGLGVQSTR